MVPVENPVEGGKISRNFIQARVKLQDLGVNLDNPLVDRMWVHRPNGSKIWVSTKYEKLQSFFFLQLWNCGS